jgi:hypothetical protein
MRYFFAEVIKKSDRVSVVSMSLLNTEHCERSKTNTEHKAIKQSCVPFLVPSCGKLTNDLGQSFFTRSDQSPHLLATHPELASDFL